jgi:hypothetical protein
MGPSMQLKQFHKFDYHLLDTVSLVNVRLEPLVPREQVKDVILAGHIRSSRNIATTPLANEACTAMIPTTTKRSIQQTKCST